MNVTCDASVGLAFVNISSLTLEGVTVASCGVTGKDNLQLFQSKLQKTTEFFYRFHSSDVIAILVGLVTDSFHS